MHTANAESLTLFMLGYCVILQGLGLLLIWCHRPTLRANEPDSDLEEIPSGLSVCIGFLGGVTPLGFIFEKYGMEQNSVLMMSLMLISTILVTYLSEKVFKAFAGYLAPNGHRIKWYFDKKTLHRLINKEA